MFADGSHLSDMSPRHQGCNTSIPRSMVRENKRRFTFGNLVIRGNLPWQRALYFASLFSEKGEVTADV